MINFLQSPKTTSLHFPKHHHTEKHVCTKTKYYSPLTKSSGCITGTKPDQRHEKKKSPLTLKHNSVKNSDIVCRVITSTVKIFPPGSFKFESDHIKDLRLQGTTV